MTSDEINQLAFKFIADNEPRIRAMLVHKSPQYADEMWSDVVVLRAPNIAKTWDPRKGASFKTHMLTNLNWYAFKYLNAQFKRLSKIKQLDAILDTSYYLPDTHSVEVVNKLLSELSRQSAAILVMRHFQGANFNEIGEALGTERGAARYHYEKALQEAKHTLFQQGLESVDDCK